MQAEPRQHQIGALHVTVSGRGPNLVLLHGWGMHSGVWDETAAALQQEYRVWRVDLPGHGRSPMPVEGDSLAGVATAVCAALPEAAQPAAWVGWSLGGLVALQAALSEPERVQRLVLVAATPRFVTAADWPTAVAPAVLDAFAGDLQKDYRATLLRFLALQARGSERAREEVRNLRQRLFEHGEPDPRALRAGLALLAQTDLRAALAGLSCPLGLLAGERDTLMPAAAVEPIRQCCAQPDTVSTAIIAGAGHAPFLSHPETFVESLKKLLHA